jgi:hypothetical protein
VLLRLAHVRAHSARHPRHRRHAAWRHRTGCDRATASPALGERRLRLRSCRLRRACRLQLRLVRPVLGLRHSPLGFADLHGQLPVALGQVHNLCVANIGALASIRGLQQSRCVHTRWRLERQECLLQFFNLDVFHRQPVEELGVLGCEPRSVCVLGLLPREPCCSCPLGRNLSL